MDHKKWQVPKHIVKEFNNKKNSYCLCIPIHNEGERFKKQLAEVARYTNMVDIIICDGGSTDGSADEGYLKKNGVTALLIKQDNGKLSAQLRIGYAYALHKGYEGIITMDGNGKDGPDAIPCFINELKKGFDYIQGSRYIKGARAINTPLIRHIANHYIHAPILSIAARHFWFSDTTNGFRAYSRKYLLDSRTQPFRSVFDTYELLAYLTVRASQLGYKVKEIPVTRRYPKGKIPTKISFFKGNMNIFKILLFTLFKKYHP